MLSLDENAQMLSAFGLTFNQAKVYITTTQLGIASISQISKVSKVRREDVYRILPKLERMGLVERILGTPIKVRATPVEETLSVLIKREQDLASKKLSMLIARKEEFLRHFNTYRMNKTFEEEEPHFILISQKDRILNKTLTMIKNAKREIGMTYSRDRLIQLIPIFSESLKKAIKKGVKIRIISEAPEREDSIPRIMEEYISPRHFIDLRYTDLPPSHYIIVDNSQVLVATSTERPFAENSKIWTDNSSFIALMQRNFEDMWHASVNWKTIETSDVPEKLMRLVGQLKPTNHVLFLYEAPEAKYNVLFNYIKMGLENGEAAVYVATEETPEQIRETMKRFGIEVEKLEKIGALRVLGCNDIYVIDGKFDISTTKALWNKFYNEALAKGFKGLRVTGETACFFKLKLIDKLLEYENSLHKILDTPMVAICAYNANVLTKAKNPINLYTELVKTHGTVLFTGIDNKLGRIEIRKA